MAPRHRRLIACMTLAMTLATTHAEATAPAGSPAPVAWGRCASEQVGIWPALGPRLECARISVPVDHLDPGIGTIELALVRVRASRSATRKGAIFFNFGGPGGSPLQLLPEMASDWAAADVDDAVEAPRRQLLDHFDLIGIVPRGMRGGWTFECIEPYASSYAFIPSSTDDVNLHKVEDEAGRAARRCNENPFYRYVNTEQNARDMEFVRRALGEDKLNYFGLSYGTWLGAWYASMFPENVGRMVFDSSMDVTGTFSEGIAMTLAAEDEALERRVLRPIAARNDLYRMGSRVDALRQRIRTMHAWTRQRLAPLVATPASFVATIRFDDWLRAGTEATRGAFERRMARTTFSQDRRTDDAIRRAATQLLSPMFDAAPPPDHHLGPDGDSVHMATLCNDDVWSSSFAHWQGVARTDSHRYPTSNGEHVYVGLFCARWGPRAIRRPDLARLNDAPPFLIVQAEYDHSTPLAGAEKVRDLFTKAHLVVARNLEGHGIYGMSRTPCVESSVANFFLEGALPEKRSTSCVEEARPDMPPPPPESLHTHTEFWRRIRNW